MKIGYCRVSTDGQDLSLQQDALKAAGAEKIYCDKVSGAKFERQGLKPMTDNLMQGDCVLVWRLDRLGRSLKDLIELISDFERQGVDFVSLHEKIDTSSSTGKLVFHIFCALSEFERNLISDRTKAGLQAARARGRVGGRPSKLNPKQIESLVSMYNGRQIEIRDICNQFGISRATLYTYIKGV